MKKQFILTLMALAPSGYLAASKANANATATATPSSVPSAADTKAHHAQMHEVILFKGHPVVEAMSLISYRHSDEEFALLEAHRVGIIERWLDLNPRVHKNAHIVWESGVVQSLLEHAIWRAFSTYKQPAHNYRRLLKKILALGPDVRRTTYSRHGGTYDVLSLICTQGCRIRMQRFHEL